jgi:hypothetical protein
MSPRATLLLSRITLAEGKSSEARAMLSEQRGVLSRFRPWPDLLAAEAAIRSGSPSGARELLEAVYGAFSGSRGFRRRCVHLRLMSELWGQVPDEPSGLAPNADIGAAMAARLGFSAGTGTDPSGEGIGREAQRRLDSYRRDRFPQAPILTLAGGAKGLANRAPGGYVLVAFLAAGLPSTRQTIQEDLLPLAHRCGPQGTLRTAIILLAESRKAFEVTARQVRASDGRGETVILWTPRRDTFFAYGITCPPFFLLVPRDYDQGLVDWEPPWGDVRMFFYRVKRRLTREPPLEE